MRVSTLALCPLLVCSSLVFASGGEGDSASARPANAAAAIALQPNEIEAEIGLALIDIRRGALETGVAELQALVERAPLGELHDRIETEIDRARAFIGLRDAHVDELIARGSPCKFEFEGEPVAAPITGLIDGRLTLGPNARGLKSVPVSVLDPYRIAREASKQVARGNGTWARSYMLVLAGDPSTWWQGNARDSDVRALRNDAQNWYPRMLRFGAAAQMLALLVSQASPADAAAAAECLDTIRALREKFGDLDMFKRRIPALRALAESALTLQFDTSEVAPVCRGKVEQLGGGRVRITYDFERGDELGDFELDHGYWSAWRARLPALAQPAPNLSIHARALRVRGAACLRHEWPFTSPVTVRAKFAFEGLQGDSGTTPIFFLAACDDRAESLVRCEAFGNLEARDVSTEFRAKDALRSGHEIEEQIPCEVALTVADGRAASYVDGAAACRVDAGPRTRGDVLIYVHSQPVIAFQRLVIEGVPDEDAVRAQWIEQNLSAMRL